MLHNAIATANTTRAQRGGQLRSVSPVVPSAPSADQQLSSSPSPSSHGGSRHARGIYALTDTAHASRPDEITPTPASHQRTAAERIKARVLSRQHQHQRRQNDALSDSSRGSSHRPHRSPKDQLLQHPSRPSASETREQANFESGPLGVVQRAAASEAANSRPRSSAEDRLDLESVRSREMMTDRDRARNHARRRYPGNKVATDGASDRGSTRSRASMRYRRGPTSVQSRYSHGGTFVAQGDGSSHSRHSDAGEMRSRSRFRSKFESDASTAR